MKLPIGQAESVLRIKDKIGRLLDARACYCENMERVKGERAKQAIARKIERNKEKVASAIAELIAYERMV